MDNRERFTRIFLELLRAGMSAEVAANMAKDILKKEQRAWEKLMAENDS